MDVLVVTGRNRAVRFRYPAEGPQAVVVQFSQQLTAILFRALINAKERWNHRDDLSRMFANFTRFSVEVHIIIIAAGFEAPRGAQPLFEDTLKLLRHGERKIKRYLRNKFYWSVLKGAQATIKYRRITCEIRHKLALGMIACSPKDQLTRSAASVIKQIPALVADFEASRAAAMGGAVASGTAELPDFVEASDSLESAEFADEMATASQDDMSMCACTSSQGSANKTPSVSPLHAPTVTLAPMSWSEGSPGSRHGMPRCSPFEWPPEDCPMLAHEHGFGTRADDERTIDDNGGKELLRSIAHDAAATAARDTAADADRVRLLVERLSEICRSFRDADQSGPLACTPSCRPDHPATTTCLDAESQADMLGLHDLEMWTAMVTAIMQAADVQASAGTCTRLAMELAVAEGKQWPPGSWSDSSRLARFFLAMKLFRALVSLVDIDVAGSSVEEAALSQPLERPWDSDEEPITEQYAQAWSVTPAITQFLELSVEAPGADLDIDIVPPKDLEYGAIIGEGSFGLVWSGMLDHAPVAIKQLAFKDKYGVLRAVPDQARELVLNRLAQEVKLLKALRHRHVLSFQGVCFEPPALITELCPFGSLWDMIQTYRDAYAYERSVMSPSTSFFSTVTSTSTWAPAPARHEGLLEAARKVLSWPGRVKVAREAAIGMKYLHSDRINVLHRDLKTPNLLLDANLECKVGDLGLSKRVTTPGCPGAQWSGEFNLNALWAAPEVMDGGEATKASDVFSFGIVLIELLQIDTPWGLDNRSDIDHLAFQRQYRSLLSVDSAPTGSNDSAGSRTRLFPPRPEVPEDLSQVPLGGEQGLQPGVAKLPGVEKFVDLMKRCWSERAEDRPSFKDIVEELQDIQRVVSDAME